MDSHLRKLRREANISGSYEVAAKYVNSLKRVKADFNGHCGSCGFGFTFPMYSPTIDPTTGKNRSVMLYACPDCNVVTMPKVKEYFLTMCSKMNTPVSSHGGGHDE